MTLDEKITQLFVLRVYGATADTTDPESVARTQAAYGVDSTAELVERYQPGGVIYFRDTGNIENPVQVAELSNAIQQAALKRSSDPIPVLITTDHEGGRVARMSPPATWIPAARVLASAGAAAATDAATLMGRELRCMGIAQNYAPVADVNVNPANPVIGDRSFSADPQVASEFVQAQVEGFQAGGVRATVKHFPGHGDTSVDTHTGRAVITHTREEWEELDLPPFQAAIAAGVDSIMTGHLIFPELDRSEAIATTSRRILTDLLRTELGFDGVVVTDGLEMSAARMAHPDHEAPLRALQAGADQLLTPTVGSFTAAVETIRKAVEDGELSVERLDQSVERILRLKKNAGLFDDPLVDPEIVAKTVGSRDHQQQARRLLSAVQS
ncbi:hypothetical protein G1H11_20335 [Phytoactinopolyspora alkaliphila]|uniref:beta-N-acetylhexosaminidase n=1 Tax=Phytoactinopolyspora alkaliphila TaxID=1783498 RepID=A0A6N9YRG8_9ACTN|nr:glycoside hydrolase family 3 protein [Phytoactinopolyspora alkaliphila]NED97651.1 hypothetical protein [Phytoactinopolyspora alkaliphila]